VKKLKLALARRFDLILPLLDRPDGQRRSAFV
jgi:hypothetical protein